MKHNELWIPVLAGVLMIGVSTPSWGTLGGFLVAFGVVTWFALNGYIRGAWSREPWTSVDDPERTCSRCGNTFTGVVPYGCPATDPPAFCEPEPVIDTHRKAGYNEAPTAPRPPAPKSSRPKLKLPGLVKQRRRTQAIQQLAADEWAEDDE